MTKERKTLLGKLDEQQQNSRKSDPSLSNCQDASHFPSQQKNTAQNVQGLPDTRVRGESDPKPCTTVRGESNIDVGYSRRDVPLPSSPETRVRGESNGVPLRD